MFKGFRWQLLAFSMAMMLFIVSFALRLLDNVDTPDITPTQTLIVNATATTTSNSTATPLPTPTPVSVMTNTVPQESTPAFRSNDGIVTFTEGAVGTIQRLNPLYAIPNTIEGDITRLLFDGLIEINEYGEPAGQLAEDWVISNDGLTYVVTLRSDVLWHDGTPVTSNDIIYTMGVLSDETFDGAQDLSAFWRTVETQYLDEQRVRFRLAQPLASFLNKLSIGLLPEHVLRGTRGATLGSHPFNLSPIGTGLYQFEAIRALQGQSIREIDLRLAPNTINRLDTIPQVERLRFRLYDTWENATSALQVGNIDGLASGDIGQRSDLFTIENVTISTTLAGRVGMLIFNWDEGEDTRFFREQRIRTALLQGLNRTAPVESRLLNQAIVADSPLLVGHWAYFDNIAYPEVNVSLALESLLNANITTTVEENDTTLHEFTILVPDEANIIALAQEIANQWSVLRLEIQVESASLEQFNQRIDDGDFDVAIVEMPLAIDPDVYAYWHVGQAPDGQNWGAVSDDRVSDLLERARRDNNGLNRVQLYREFQERFIERAVAIPLYYPLYSYAVRDDVEGVHLSTIYDSVMRFITLPTWDLP